MLKLGMEDPDLASPTVTRCPNSRFAILDGRLNVLKTAFPTVLSAGRENAEGMNICCTVLVDRFQTRIASSICVPEGGPAFQDRRSTILLPALN